MHLIGMGLSIPGLDSLVAILSFFLQAHRVTTLSAKMICAVFIKKGELAARNPEVVSFGITKPPSTEHQHQQTVKLS